MGYRRGVAVLAIAAVGLAGLGAGCGSGDGAETPADPAAQAGGMSHGPPVEAPRDVSMSLRVVPDSKKGYNAVITTKGFRFTPAAAGGEHVAGEGHAHLFVDGVQVARPYSSWHWLALDPGMHEVRVTLNANTHSEYARDGEVIEAATMVHVSEADDHTHADGEDHDHDHDDGEDDGGDQNGNGGSGG